MWAILRNPAYKGKAAFGKTEAVERSKLLRPIRGKNAVPKHAKSTYRDKPQEEWIHIEVPALVSAELFDAAAEQLERNKRLSERNGRGKRYLLQGLVVCGCCGYAFYGKRVSPSAAKGKPRRYAYYRCVGSDAYRFAGGRICHNPQVRVDQLDDYVWESVRDLLQDPSRVMEEWSRRAATDGVAAELRSQRDEAARLVASQERSLQRLVDAYEAEALSLPELTARSRRVRQRLKSAQDELKAAESRLADSVELREVIGRLECFCVRLRHGLDKLNWEERRQLIRTLVARVEIEEDGATVVYRVPGSRDSHDPDRSARSGTSGETSAQICQLRERRHDSPLRGAGRSA